MRHKITLRAERDHIILYRIAANEIVVGRIFHGAQSRSR
jgi:plasmid stabilization system protein ParE